ncbi:sulfocyanin-like copper-binding protein [Amycolatopsis alkalitolerans]|uniref:Sulfocyanin-like C-terminal domain-containing protein n=1 Tax=Amycolatopsis alkalitolerans TaxID=2547244 RepID=A0A5C4M6Q3_9PSEU|nr:sulfocyanin-like copper-binding protein [Amycolatopsis alkalitolerans]TNC26477.1 hypothetical protein FG385_12035 [Amycolatopsis alkalitolerans]
MRGRQLAIAGAVFAAGALAIAGTIALTTTGPGTAAYGPMMGATPARGGIVSDGSAAGLAARVPAGASVDSAGNTLVFHTSTVAFTAVASPPDEGMYTFGVAGMTNPVIEIPRGARVSIEVVNADDDMPHGLVVTSGQAAAGPMPMMTTVPSFPGAAVWTLAQASPAGLSTATETFTAGVPGRYQYLCPVPGHAAAGMAGAFVVTGSDQ